MSGGNIDINILSRIIDRGLDFGGRIAQISTRLPDKPGALEGVLSIFRRAGANILEVYQHRYSKEVPVGQVNVAFTLETRNKEHIAAIEETLRTANYEIYNIHWERHRH